MDKTLEMMREPILKAKQIADDKEYQRSRMAHVNGQADLGWIDFFIEALDNMDMRLIKLSSLQKSWLTYEKIDWLTQFERVEE